MRRHGRDLEERNVRAGTQIVRQGHMSGVDFFVIVDGEVAVTVDGKEVARLGPGDHFGELALIGERERSSTVTAPMMSANVNMFAVSDGPKSKHAPTDWLSTANKPTAATGFMGTS